MPRSFLSLLRSRLAQHFLRKQDLLVQPVSGGSINQCYRIQYGDEHLFCKVNAATKFPQLFVTEKQSLSRLAQTAVFRTPRVFDCFEEEGYQFLLLEWMTEGHRTTAFWRRFGEQLAALHQVSADRFGLEENNYMGSVLQENRPHDSWCSFFAEARILPLVKKCADQNQLGKWQIAMFESVLHKLPLFFMEEAPSLLHGDLWSGNFLCGPASEPVLIDPAVYYGHRAVDLGMTTLFGGFDARFYEAYQYHFPLPANYKEQRALCNLYPLLIHLYLFGRAYLPQIEATLKHFK